MPNSNLGRCPRLGWSAPLALGQDEALLRFFEQVGQETLANFSTEDFLLLDHVRRGEAPRAEDRPRLRELAGLGLLEPINRGRARAWVLARRYYQQTGRGAEYTRRRGLDRITLKALLEEHLRLAGSHGAPLPELQQVLPHIEAGQVKRMLQELKTAGRVRVVGLGRGSRWYLIQADSVA